MAWSWDDGQHHRFYLENEVHLPLPLMLYQEFNTEARVVALQTRLVLDCYKVNEKRREWELRCDIADIAFTGAGMLGDRGNLDAVLKEVDGRLDEAYLQVVLRKDGRIKDIDLEGMDRRNRRLSQNVETLRLLLSRTLAGLSLQLPASAEEEGRGWGQTQSLLMATPSPQGLRGNSELVHMVRRTEGDRMTIETQGRGVVTAGDNNTYTMEMSSMSRFDTRLGVLQQRKWTAIGEPTAGSLVAEGVEAVNYLQAGSIVYLGEDDPNPVLGHSVQAAIPGARAPGALQLWAPIPALGD